MEHDPPEFAHAPLRILREPSGDKCFVLLAVGRG
jgi:hypothetical protein